MAADELLIAPAFVLKSCRPGFVALTSAVKSVIPMRIAPVDVILILSDGAVSVVTFLVPNVRGPCSAPAESVVIY